MEIVVSIHKSFGSVLISIKAAPYIFSDIINTLFHEAIIVYMLLAIHIIHNNIVWTGITLTSTTWILTETKRHEFNTVGGCKVSFCPVTYLLAFAIIPY